MAKTAATAIAAITTYTISSKNIVEEADIVVNGGARDKGALSWVKKFSDGEISLRITFAIKRLSVLLTEIGRRQLGRLDESFGKKNRFE